MLLSQTEKGLLEAPPFDCAPWRYICLIYFNIGLILYLIFLHLKSDGLIFGMNEDIWLRFWMDNGYTKNRTGSVGWHCENGNGPEPG
jgi:hypothetical protein